MNIRHAELIHADEIAKLHTASWRSTYSKELNASYLRDIVPFERISVWRNRLSTPKENQFVLIAEERGVIVGFACAFAGEHPDWGSYLDNLHIIQSHQGRGLGKRLLVKIAALCEQQCPNQSLHLLVNQTNMRAQQFYLSLGAHNAQAAVWNAPDGSQIPTFRFAWNSIAELPAL